MKKSLFPILLGMLAAGCANNEPGTTDQTSHGNTSLEAKGYLSVKLVAPGGLTRAEDTPPSVSGDYEYGTASENYVKEVRLYFFDDEGKGVAIRKNPLYESNSSAPEYFSYYDWDPTPDENELPEDYESGDTEQDPGNAGTLPDGTVEKILTVMVTLTGKDNVFPSQVAAIINPTPEIKQITQTNPIVNLDQLQGLVFDNLTGLTSSNFVMSSSVYVNKESDITITQPVTEENLGYTQTEAQEEPVIVYVERAVARLDMNFNLTETAEGSGIYSTQKKVTTEDRTYEGDNAPQGVEQLMDEDIYVKFLGWAVTSTPTSSYVIKKISSQWGDDDELFGVLSQPWFIPAYHRSFWATNPPLSKDPTKGDYVWFTFNELSGADPDIAQLGFPMTKDQTYMQENANPSTAIAGQDPEEPTKVIFAAQLVDSKNKPLTFAAWNGLYFTLPGLQTLAASMLDMYYIQPATDENPAKYVPISPDQITFITASQYAGTNPLFTDTPNYTVYATLTSAKGTDASDPIKNAAGLQWYHLDDNVKPADAKPTDYTKIGNSEQSTYLNTINSYMSAVFGNAQVWNNGYTYYYYTIRHLGALDNPGYYGVVRNHIYNGTVTGLKGLGTPVWDPNEKIYPEEPNDDGNNLSAKIEVLSWRLVSDSYEFEW